MIVWAHQQTDEFLFSPQQRFHFHSLKHQGQISYNNNPDFIDNINDFLWDVELAEQEVKGKHTALVFLLKKEIAKKATKNLPFARDIVRFGLGIPSVWSITEYLLGKVDHRPGRHYSFIANRPE